jgi:hypothetical protein
MSFGDMFHRSSTSGAAGSSSHPDSWKKPQREREVPEGDFKKEYKRLYDHKVIPTKWVDDEFLSRKGLNIDFTSLVGNVGLEVFSLLIYDTYKSATLKFLVSFHDELTILGRETAVSFRLNGASHVFNFMNSMVASGSLMREDLMLMRRLSRGCNNIFLYT